MPFRGAHYNVRVILRAVFAPKNLLSLLALSKKKQTLRYPRRPPTQIAAALLSK